MTMKYVKIRIWADSLKNLQNRKRNAELDLRKLGINKKIPMTKFIHAQSRVGFTLEDAGLNSLKQLAGRKHKI